MVQALILSTAAKQVMELVLNSSQSKATIPYKRDFLERYRPNQTRYIDEATSQKLRQAGTISNNNCDRSKRLVLELAWNSSRLEGNTYSLLQTEKLLNCTKGYKGSSDNEIMLINHREAIEFLLECAETYGVSTSSIYNIHSLLSAGLLGNPKACGQLRSIEVRIGGTAYQPISIPSIIRECFEQIIDKAKAIDDPFEQAFFLMVHLPYLQPFEDVNKRTSRLAANIPLIKNHLCPITFADIDKRDYTDGFLGVYEHNRIELLRDIFVWGYLRSCSYYHRMIRSSLT